MVLPIGLLNRHDAIVGMGAAPPWDHHHLTDMSVVELAPDSWAVMYRAHARRSGQAPYDAWMVSIYIAAGDGWLLALHQQTPLRTAPVTNSAGG